VILVNIVRNIVYVIDIELENSNNYVCDCETAVCWMTGEVQGRGWAVAYA